MSSIFGGSKATSNSSNLAYNDISKGLGGNLGLAGQGGAGIMSLLGGDASGFNKYKDATGFNFASEQGSRGITGNAAARGLLRSGSTGKALVNYGQGMQDQYAGNYMDRLMGVSDIGLKSGSVMAQAGQVQNEKRSEKPGIGKFLGQIGAGVAMSDRRLKMNIYKVGEFNNGLNVYQYRYIDGSGPFIGVMADEVAAIQPEALGPVIDGYASVDYDKIAKEFV